MTTHELTLVPSQDSGRKGFMDTCSCGWCGPHRADPDRAKADGERHVAAKAKAAA